MRKQQKDRCTSVGGAVLLIAAVLLPVWAGPVPASDQTRIDSSSPSTAVARFAVIGDAGTADEHQLAVAKQMLAALVTALAAGGTLAGTALSHRTAPQKLRRGFAVFVIAVAAFLIAENYSAQR